MSAAARLYSEVTAAGLTLTPNGNQIRVSPAAKLTPHFAARIREAKAELLQLLTTEATDDELLADTRELDALITRLCDFARYPDAMRAEMLEARRRASPDTVRTDLAAVRGLLRDINAASENSKNHFTRP